MSDDAAAAPAPTQTKSPKKKSSKPKKPSNHPKYSKMIHDGLTSLKERGGSSRQALLKYIVANFNVGKDEKTVNNHLKLALRAGVKNGTLKQSKGTGASGSFRLGDKADKSAKPKAKVKKPKAAKPKSPGKPKKPKAKKPAAKKAKSPAKKEVKKAVKSPAKKAAGKPKKAKKAAKKSPAKKAAKKAAKK
ncbi:hypothetical protein ACOMHN_046359 [Nucella lapillus]